jgi:hypothetical protein
MEAGCVMATELHPLKELRMSTKTQIIEEQSVCTPIEAQALKTQPLQEIVNMVRRDSQIEPQAYLEESKVPHGGE